MCPDRFPEAFERYKGPNVSVKAKGITTFDELIADVEEWGIKSPRGGMTYKQEKALAKEAKKEGLKDIYITQDFRLKSGKYVRVYRDAETGAFISKEKGEVQYKRDKGNWFDGTRWRNEKGQFIKKPETGE